MKECAGAALRGGATALAVATASEAFELRAAQAEVPILIMGALTPAEMDVALTARADVAVWRLGFAEALAARAAGARRPAPGPRQVRHGHGPPRRP